MRRLSIKNIKIKTKLFVLGGICIAGLVFLGAESVLTAREINQASTEISQSWLPATILAEELNTDIFDYRNKEYYHVITHDQMTMDKMEKEMSGLRQRIDDAFLEYENYITSDEDRTLMENASLYWQRYLGFSDRLLLLSRQRAKNEAMEMAIGDSKKMFEEASANFVDMAEFNRKGAEEASIHADNLYSSLAKVKIFTVLLISLVIVLLIIYIIRGIEKPVRDIVDGTRRVSNGDLDVRLTYQSDDEIGVLTDSINQLIERLKNMIDDEKFLFKEIGNGNFEAHSTCEQAYRGDFAPILYSIAGLMSRLDMTKKNLNAAAMARAAEESGKAGEEKNRTDDAAAEAEDKIAAGRKAEDSKKEDIKEKDIKEDIKEDIKTEDTKGTKTEGTTENTNPEDSSHRIHPRKPAQLEKIGWDGPHAERIIPDEDPER